MATSSGSNGGCGPSAGSKKHRKSTWKLSLGCAASQVIQSPFGEWAYGAIVMALLVCAFRYRSKPVAGWMIWWNICSLIMGFEILLWTSITNPFQAVALIAVLMLALVISWSVILSPLGLIWFLKVFVEPALLWPEAFQ